MEINQTVSRGSIWINNKINYYILILELSNSVYNDDILVSFRNLKDGKPYSMLFKDFSEQFTKIIDEEWL